MDDSVSEEAYWLLVKNTVLYKWTREQTVLNVIIFSEQYLFVVVEKHGTWAENINDGRFRSFGKCMYS